MSDEHVDSSGQHEGLLGSMDTDLSNIQVEFRAQRGMLQALHTTQNEHTAALRKLETGQEELRLGQAELRLGQGQILAGVQAIADLLKSADDANAGGNS